MNWFVGLVFVAVLTEVTSQGKHYRPSLRLCRVKTGFNDRLKQQPTMIPGCVDLGGRDRRMSKNNSMCVVMLLSGMLPIAINTSFYISVIPSRRTHPRVAFLPQTTANGNFFSSFSSKNARIRTDAVVIGSATAAATNT